MKETGKEMLWRKGTEISNGAIRHSRSIIIAVLKKPLPGNEKQNNLYSTFIYSSSMASC